VRKKLNETAVWPRIVAQDAARKPETISGLSKKTWNSPDHFGFDRHFKERRKRDSLCLWELTVQLIDFLIGTICKIGSKHELWQL